MTTLIKYIVYTATLLASTFAFSQSYTATVVSAQTGEPIPFATVQFSQNSGTITNENGIFSIDMSRVEKLQDSIRISSMGFKNVSVYPTKATDTIITLKEQLNELDNVFLTNIDLEPEDIIDRVKENLATNYRNDYTEKKLFFRQTLHNKIKDIDVEFKKSTIEELNEQLIDSVVMQISRESDYYSESVGTLYGNYQERKLSINKAAKLYDKSKDVSFEGFGKRLEKIFQENVKPDSYLKVKSGWFGTKVDLDELKEGRTD